MGRTGSGLGGGLLGWINEEVLRDSDAVVAIAKEVGFMISADELQ